VSGRDVYRGGTFTMSLAMVVLGAVALVRTALAAPSGIALGYLLGAGLMAAGALRIVLLRKTR
jgi:hypothetical protein